ncbi:MAG TPA: FemAB family PEP-CTERM system-associated protein [Janthinobacterium sp.]|nr:FemAB family PEP-CTERM system-associated protein [Janthinobacterium sp.]
MMLDCQAVLPASLSIGTMDASDAARWDEFVLRCPQATFFHRAGWKTVIEGAFGHKTWFLYAQAGGRILGVLPLAQIDSLLFGHSLCALPFCVYGGIAASDDAAAAALDLAAQELAARLRVDYLEYRNLGAARHPDWLAKSLYVTFRKSLHAEPEQNMLAIPRKQRAMVRKGMAAGLHSAVDYDIGRFFPAYAGSVHRLGTPVFGKRYFELLRTVFGKDCDILTIYRNNETISSVLSFYFRDEVLPYYGGGTEAARALAGNDFMYWEVMRRACERGCTVFDFGRSKLGTGAFDFKKNWGFAPQALHYEYKLLGAQALPDVNPLNPRYRLFIRAWRRLPLPLANALGPHIVRNLG